jgi:diguanylate cyclase (GGDEF)-like protein/PAS domain S-box-containing protein
MITEDNLHAFLETMPIGIWRQAADQKFAWANNAFCRVAGYSLAELQTLETLELVKPSWRKFVMERNRAILNGELEGPYYFPSRTKTKKELIVMGTIGLIGAHLYGGYIAPIYIDQERDTVSGLFNEIVFYRRLRELVEVCYAGNRQPFTMMAIGIDRYRDLLTQVGHLKTDALVRRIGETIGGMVEEDCCAARMVDGQFGILFPELIDTRHRLLAQKLIDHVRLEGGQGLELMPTLSISIVEYNENTHGKMDRKLVSHAYRTMFRIQSEGGNALAFAPAP